MLELVSQAQEAASQGNWSALVQQLQQLLLTEHYAELTSETKAVLLELAIQLLATGDFQEQWDVAKLLPRFGDAAIAPLITLLNQEEAELEARWFAARVLGESNHPLAVGALVELLQTTTDDDLSEAAAEALANLGPTSVEIFTPLLGEPAYRLYAAKALAQIRHSETIPALLTVIHDPDPRIREMALEALSSFHDPRIPPVLLQALTDPSAAVRQVAVAGLGVRSGLATELALVDQLSSALWDVDLRVCQRAIAALGRLGEDGAIPALLRAFTTPSTPNLLRTEVLRAFGWISSRASLSTLMDLLKAEPPLETTLAATAIAIIGRWETADMKPLAAQGLAEILSYGFIQANADLRRELALALGQLQQPSALATLIQLLADPDTSVKLHAIAALKNFSLQTLSQEIQTLQRSPALPPPLQHGISIALQEWQLELT